SCLARSLMADSIANVKPAISELFASIRASLSDPRTSRALFANLLGILFFGLIAAGTTFVLVLFMRYWPLYGHDVHHLFPIGARRWQTRMLAAVLILLPLFLQLGPLPLVFTVLFACALYAS